MFSDRGGTRVDNGVEANEDAFEGGQFGVQIQN